MRMVIRHNLRYPDNPLASINTVMKIQECGEHYREYFYIFLATTILLLLIIFFSSILYYYNFRSGSLGEP